MHKIKSRHWFNIIGLIIIFASVTYFFRSTENLNQIVYYFNIAFVDNYKTTVSRSGNELRVDGGIRSGISDEIQKIIFNNPNIKTIELNSTGVDVFEAKKFYKIIQSHHLNTVVNNKCIDMCIVPYLAGAQRWIGLEGNIGVFHSYAFPRFSPASNEFTELFNEVTITNGISREYLESLLSNNGIAAHYIDRHALLSNKIISTMRSEAESSLIDYDARLTPYWTDRKKDLLLIVDKNIAVIDYSVEKGIVSSIIEYNDEAFDELSRSDLNYDNLLNMMKTSVCSLYITKLQTDRGVIFRFRYEKKSNKKKYIDIDVHECD